MSRRSSADLRRWLLASTARRRPHRPRPPTSGPEGVPGDRASFRPDPSRAPVDQEDWRGSHRRDAKGSNRGSVTRCAGQSLVSNSKRPCYASTKGPKGSIEPPASSPPVRTGSAMGTPALATGDRVRESAAGASWRSTPSLVAALRGSEVSMTLVVLQLRIGSGYVPSATDSWNRPSAIQAGTPCRGSLGLALSFVSPQRGDQV